MSEQINAIFENGVFRPLQPVSFAESQTVTLTVTNSASSDATQEPWTDEKNARRCELIDKHIQQSITDAERRELDLLQQQMRSYLDQEAPLDLESPRRLHRELLEKKRRREQQE